MLLKSELLVMWCMMRLWCAETRRGVGDEHCSADSGGGDVPRAPPRDPRPHDPRDPRPHDPDPLSDHSCAHTDKLIHYRTRIAIY